MNQEILHLTDKNFSEYILNPVNIKNEALFLIDFWADWCNPCQRITPIIDDISIELSDKITVAKVNIDHNPIITKKYNIKSIPTLLLIRKGIVLSTHIGLVSKEKLIEFINLYL